MSVIATLLVIFGLGIYLLSAIFFIIAAFRQSILWGLAVLFLSPPAALIFLFLHWPRARNPFFLMLWGLAFVALGHLVFHASLPWPLG